MGESKSVSIKEEVKKTLLNEKDIISKQSKNTTFSINTHKT